MPNLSVAWSRQDSASSINREAQAKIFDWTEEAIYAGYELLAEVTDVFEGVGLVEQPPSDPSLIWRATVTNLNYDALSSLISTLRLAYFGQIADSWTLVRSAFESTCLAEYFGLFPDRVEDYSEIGAKLTHNNAARTGTLNLASLLRDKQLTSRRIHKALQGFDGEGREMFYSRLSNFGVHASPVRSGLRINLRGTDETVFGFVTVNHRELPQLASDIAACANYAFSLLVDARISSFRAFDIPESVKLNIERLQSRYHAEIHPK